jgi:peptide/nickel transport system substrate-binding protein
VVNPSPVWEALYLGISPASYDDGYLPGMGDRQDLFGDTRTRKALAMCVNREKIIQEYWSGTSVVPVSMLDRANPLSLGVDRLVPYDPAQAIALLEEIGWKDMDQNPATPRVAVNIPTVFLGTPLQFTLYSTNAELRKSVGTQIVSDLAACGVAVTMKDYTPEDLFANGPDGPLFGRNFDSASLSWSPSTMPACQFFSSAHIPLSGNAWYGVNIGGFSDKAFDEACLTASSALPGEEKYLEAQQAVQTIFVDQLPVIPLYQYVRVGLSQPDLCGYQMDATSRSSLWNIENMASGQACPD